MTVTMETASQRSVEEVDVWSTDQICAWPGDKTPVKSD